MKKRASRNCKAIRPVAEAKAVSCWYAPAGDTAFIGAVLLTALALSTPAIVTYAELKRERGALYQATSTKKAFMSACVENFKTAYCETIWRTAENLPPGPHRP